MVVLHALVRFVRDLRCDAVHHVPDHSCAEEQDGKDQKGEERVRHCFAGRFELV